MKKIKVLLSVLFVAGMFAVFAGCDHGNVNNHPEDVPQNLNPNDDPQTDPSSNPSSDPSTDPMTGYQYVGKKKPSEKKAVGDIVYFDGSATNVFSKDPYTGRNRVLESDFYAATTGSAQGHAVAYIFYAGEDGALGIGLEPERTEWTSIQTKASQYHTKYYKTDDVVRRMFTPDALKSGWRVPSKADLEKMLEDIDLTADVLAFKTNNSYFNATYDSTRPNVTVEKIWSSTEGETDNEKAYCLLYQRVNVFNNEEKNVLLVSKDSTQTIFLPIHEF